MPFRGREFLKVAREIYNHSDPAEAHYRTAIGRAYYAAFIEVRSLWIDRELNPSITNTGSDHQILKKHFHIIGSGEAGKYRQLQNYRTNADYDLPFPEHADVREVARRSIDLADDLVLCVDDYRASSR